MGNALQKCRLSLHLPYLQAMNSSLKSESKIWFLSWLHCVQFLQNSIVCRSLNNSGNFKKMRKLPVRVATEKWNFFLLIIQHWMFFGIHGGKILQGMIYCQVYFPLFSWLHKCVDINSWFFYSSVFPTRTFYALHKKPTKEKIHKCQKFQ